MPTSAMPGMSVPRTAPALESPATAFRPRPEMTTAAQYTVMITIAALLAYVASTFAEG
ncbi:MAG: hypothetical protein ABSG43_25345 [Solirubrobacteraceae bacterium]